MRLGLKRYEIDIRLYSDEECKSLFKFIHWHTWAWYLPMAKLIARFEAEEQIHKYQQSSHYTCEVRRAGKE